MMGLRIDCGDVELSCNITFGMNYKTVPEGEAAEEVLKQRELVRDIKPNLEKTVLMQIADHIGYDQETIEAKIKARDETNAANREAEEKGSAEMRARREGR